MKRFKIILPIVIMILAIACQQGKSDKSPVNEKTNESKAKYCDNQLQLITAADTLPIIEIDFDLNSDTIFEFIENAFNKNICDEMAYFGLPYDTQTKTVAKTEQSIPLLVRVLKSCSTAWCYIPPNITILINKNGQLLIGNKLGNKDSLRSWIQYHYFDSPFPLIDRSKDAFVLLHWDSQVNKDSLTSVFSPIIDSYLITADRYSRKNFKKDVCDLTEAQVSTVLKNLPFNFQLTLGVKNNIKPPPPVIHNVHNPNF